LGEPDPDYIEMLESRVFQGIEAAAGRLEPVFVERGRGKCHFSVHRRKLVDGRIDKVPNESVM
jgi:hypothetical protein